MTNKTNIVKVLQIYIEKLLQIQQALEKEEGASIYRLFETSRDYRNSIPDTSSGPIKKVYAFYCDMADEAGGIATLATILASNGINLKNIGIVHNREFEEAVLRVELYDEDSCEKAVKILRRYRYTVYEH